MRDPLLDAIASTLSDIAKAVLVFGTIAVLLVGLPMIERMP